MAIYFIGGISLINRDSIGMRLGQILKIFMNGERVTTYELANEFGVDVRTIQRDLSERLAYLPLKRDSKKRYYLQEEALGRLGFKDIREFARLSGIAMLYPSLSDEFIRDMLLSHMQPDTKNNAIFPIIVKNQGFEDSVAHYETFRMLSVAILHYQCISFTYKQKQRKVNPYRLINNNGIWYLLADDNGVLKHFILTHIKQIEIIAHSNFKPNPKLEEAILKNDNIWINTETKEVTLEISNQAREYFFRKHFISKPKIIEEKEDSFIITCNFSYDDEVLNLVKAFLPFITIISPLSLKEKLFNMLQDYITAYK